MSRERPSQSSAIQALLLRAAGDDAVARRLLDERDRLADDEGPPLSPSERAILRAVSGDHLRRMIDGLRDQPPRREFLRLAGSLALGTLALGKAVSVDEAWAEPTPGPPAGIRPDLPWFEGEVEIVNHRTLVGPSRALPDEQIERALRERSLREFPPRFEGRLSFQLQVSDRGAVTSVKPQVDGVPSKAAVDALALVLSRASFAYAPRSTTLSLDVALTPRPRWSPWSGTVEMVDLDVAGPSPEDLLRRVRGLQPRLVAALGDPSRIVAGKLRYMFRIDLEGRVVDPQITRNTAVTQMAATAARQVIAEEIFPRTPGTRWCRFSLAFLPVAGPR